MIVVADTSPINYLLLIKEIDILPKMYGTVVIPRAVQEELLRPVAPEIVRAWIGGAPAWLEIRSPIDAPDSSLVNLQSGGIVYSSVWRVPLARTDPKLLDNSMDQSGVARSAPLPSHSSAS
jgi:hypothetical protein